MFFFVSSKQKIGILTNFCSVCYFWKEGMQNDVMMGSMKNKEGRRREKKGYINSVLIRRNGYKPKSLGTVFFRFQSLAWLLICVIYRSLA